MTQQEFFAYHSYEQLRKWFDGCKDLTIKLHTDERMSCPDHGIVRTNTSRCPYC